MMHGLTNPKKHRNSLATAVTLHNFEFVSKESVFWNVNYLQKA